MTTPNPTRDAFDAAQDFRKAIPLPAGRYKLEEALWELRRLRRTVELVSRIVRNKGPKAAKAALASCAPEERGTYLKRIPRLVGDLLGRKILPGIAKLKADGVPKADVHQLTKAAKAQVEVILRDCDAAHQLLRQGIRHEHEALKAGRSHLLPLLDAAEAVAVDALCSVRYRS